MTANTLLERFINLHSREWIKINEIINNAKDGKLNDYERGFIDGLLYELNENTATKMELANYIHEEVEKLK